jgi:hypothetical protein
MSSEKVLFAPRSPKRTRALLASPSIGEVRRDTRTGPFLMEMHPCQEGHNEEITKHWEATN